MARMTYDFITTEATSDEGMSVRNATYFHCFNPNGAYAKMKEMHAALDRWLADHPEMPNGVLFVYGSLNNFYYDLVMGENGMLQNLKKRRNITSHFHSCLRAVERHTAEAYEWMADETRWPAPKENA